MKNQSSQNLFMIEPEVFYSNNQTIDSNHYQFKKTWIQTIVANFLVCPWQVELSTSFKPTWKAGLPSDLLGMKSKKTHIDRADL